MDSKVVDKFEFAEIVEDTLDECKTVEEFLVRKADMLKCIEQISEIKYKFKVTMGQFKENQPSQKDLVYGFCALSDYKKRALLRKFSEIEFDFNKDDIKVLIDQLSEKDILKEFMFEMNNIK